MTTVAGRARAGWWLATPIIAALLAVGGGLAGRATIALAVAVAVAAVVRPAWRVSLALAARALLIAATLTLVWHLAADHFQYHYVWLYSGQSLPWYLKVANLWGGEEGTLLFLATLFACFAALLTRYRGWAAPGALALTAAFALAAVFWNPFAPSPAADLARLASRGMNAHLMVPWMAVHPPLVFLAYALLLVPVGAALEALATGRGDWPVLAARYFRAGWLLLTAGLGFGMWWAFQDATFGQIWHWDPVQTSVFIAWALASAVLHGLRRYRPDGAYGRVLPLLAVLTGCMALGAMLVTRNATLASSHRYIGETSAPALLAMIGVLLAAALAALWYSRRRRLRTPHHSLLRTLISLAIALFVVVAVFALVALGDAFLNAWLGRPRPDSMKPFFEMLARWTQGDELAALKRVFDQWDVDGLALNRWLAPVGMLIGLVGGHTFVALVRRRVAWPLTALVVAAALLTPWWWQPIDQHFGGDGMTSQRTVHMFYWLDGLTVTSLYLVLAAAGWTVRRLRHGVTRAFWSYGLPVGLVHVGAMLALLAAISATVLDSYVQATVAYPQEFGPVKRLPGGYAITLKLDRYARVNDGGLRAAPGAAFHAVADVSLAMGKDGATRVEGRTLYRDDRPPAAADIGPVRELCQMLDYRYARYLSDGTNRLDPFIYRGLWRDIQVWVPPVAFAANDGPEPTEITVLIRSYPLLSWLWLGLVLIVVGAAVLLLQAPLPATGPRRR